MNNQGIESMLVKLNLISEFADEFDATTETSDCLFSNISVIMMYANALKSP